jgi:alkanesulfonate monooxygenase SsuD/methylene tetrahydromethanopterin reductase-like flavin-dependent oxidoreductase (luciferase family)
MRVGVSLRSAYGVSDGRVGARWMVERARAAAAAGLDSLFVGDHHATGGPYYQNAPILGRLLAEWGDAAAGVLYLLPLWPPVLVAEQVATLAALAEGPFVLQCALGDGEGQFAALGVDIRRRRELFEDGLAVVRRLLAGGEVGGACIGPVPDPPVEVWVGGGAPAAIDRAARLGDAWLCGPPFPPEEAGRQAAAYLDACRRHGRLPTAVAVRRDVHVGADDADARRVAGAVVDAGYRGFPPGAVVVGGPARVAEELRVLAGLGFTDVIVRHLVEDQREVLASFERLADVRRMVADA